MPELPDLEVFSTNLTYKLKHRRLLCIKFADRSVIDSPLSKVKKSLERQRLNMVFKEGKELRFQFENDQVLGLHLMLHGKMEWVQKETPPKYVLADLFFDKNLHLAVTDFQRKANFKWNPAPSAIPDALDREVNLQWWKNILQSKKTIKSLLIDQHIIRGIGNAYADEILWSAKISPFSIAGKIPPDKIKSLHTAVKKVLRHAISAIKKSKPGIIGGEVRDFLLIHHPGKKKSPTGAAIQIKKAGGRKTYFTKEQAVFL